MVTNLTVKLLEADLNLINKVFRNRPLQSDNLSRILFQTIHNDIVTGNDCVKKESAIVQ